MSKIKIIQHFYIPLKEMWGRLQTCWWPFYLYYRLCSFVCRMNKLRAGYMIEVEIWLSKQPGVCGRPYLNYRILKLLTNCQWKGDDINIERFSAELTIISRPPEMTHCLIPVSDPMIPRTSHYFNITAIFFFCSVMVCRIGPVSWWCQVDSVTQQTKTKNKFNLKRCNHWAQSLSDILRRYWGN